MTHIDTMKQALEALEIGQDFAELELLHRQAAYAGYPHKWADVVEDIAAIKAARTALRLAIKQAEQQEPVAWMHAVVSGDGAPDHALSFAPDNFPLQGVGGFKSVGVTPLYTAPSQRQPLSQQEIDEIIMQHTGGFIGGMHFVRLARAIEAAHGIKGGS